MENSHLSRLRSSRSRSKTPQNFNTISKIASPDSDNVFTSSTKTLRTRTVHTRQRTSDYSSEDLSPESHKDKTAINNFGNSSSLGQIEVTSSGGEASARKTFYQTESNNGFSSPAAEHPAYKEYHEAGEYWNKYPKTDYTYSKRSPHRREIANGYVGMPNMSRKSLSGYSERVASLPSTNKINFEKYRQTHIHTSQTDLNKVKRRLQTSMGRDVIDNNYRNEQYVQQQIATRWYQMIWIKILSTTTWFKSLFIKTTNYNARDYRSPVANSSNLHKKSVLSRVTSSITLAGLHVMSWIYWLMGTVLIIDCTLLSGRGNSTAGPIVTRPTSRTLWLLVLIPLAILGGFYLYLLLDESNYEISIPNLNPFPKPLSEYSNDAYGTASDYYDVVKQATFNGGQELNSLWQQTVEYSQNTFNYLTE